MSTTKTRYVYDTEINVQIEANWCPVCGVPYGMPASYWQARREDHKTWYCPNGCRLHYPVGSSEAEKLKVELDAARSLAQRESRRRQNAEADARRAEYQRRYAKGQLTKERKRIANGVCPCCNRTFTPLMEHIKTEHPDYVVPDESS